MRLIERIRSRWARLRPPVAFRALALIAMAGGLSAIFAAVFPANPEAPAALLGVVGVILLCGSLVIWGFGNRMAPWAPHVAIAIGTLIISLLIARAATGVGMIVTASDYMWIGVYAAFFFSRPAARAHLVLIVTGFGVALLVSDIPLPLDAWLFMSASFVVATETIGRQSARLRHEAHTDSLTGLLNRKGLKPAAEQAFSLADRTQIPLTVALIDLDNFKQVNDRDGHAAGDRLLVELTASWGGELEPTDIFARLGGDEFLVVLVGSNERECDRLFERLRSVSPTAWSAGIVRREPGEDLSACLARADNALYDAKRSRWVHADRELEPAAPSEPQVETPTGVPV